MIARTLQERLLAASRKFPLVTVTGPRQAGKTTLCRAVFPDKHYVSLEAPDVRDYARGDPRAFLAEHAEGAILDEVQRLPELLSYLQVEVDERPQRGRFVLTGSANFALLQSISQSLAGRTAVLHLLPCGLEEVRRFGPLPADLFEVLWKGSFPALHDRALEPAEWFSNYVETYVERDVRRVLAVGDLTTFQTFVRLCAGRTAQLVNLSGVGSDAGIVHGTVRSWLSVLEASYLAFRVPPFHANVSKRLVKTPKLHFIDSGLLCYLLGIREPEHLRHHPLRGAIFESWVASEIMKARLHRGRPSRLAFYRDRKGSEVDLIVESGDRLIAVETKSGQTLAGDAFANLDSFARLHSRERQRWRITRVLVYGGDERQNRSAGSAVPWAQIDGFDWI